MKFRVNELLYKEPGETKLAKRIAKLLFRNQDGVIRKSYVKLTFGWYCEFGLVELSNLVLVELYNRKPRKELPISKGAAHFILNEHNKEFYRDLYWGSLSEEFKVPATEKEAALCRQWAQDTAKALQNYIEKER